MRSDPSLAMAGGRCGRGEAAGRGGGGLSLLDSHCLREMGGGMLTNVLGWRPDLNTLSWPSMPPETHFPSCFPRHGFVRSFGAVSAKAPQATHQKMGSLTTMQCLRPEVPVASDASSALAVQEIVAVPWHVCGASLLHVMDFALHSAHHHPARRRCNKWPPSLGCLALVVLRLPV